MFRELFGKSSERVHMLSVTQSDKNPPDENRIHHLCAEFGFGMVKPVCSAPKGMDTFPAEFDRESPLQSIESFLLKN